jgi:Secretion system C-terminal sorting domain
MKKIFTFGIAVCIALPAFLQPTQPAAPIACNAGACTPATSETCTGASTVVTSFTGATLRSGAGTGNAVGAVYSFYNIATISGQQINATITIDATSNVSMTGGNFSIDDDAATDQANNSIASFFAPRITADQNLTTTDRRGYVQFTIRFYIENGTALEQYPGDYTTPPVGGLLGLNYLHYDIDGSTVGTNGWFRETGVVANVTGLSVNGDVSTELVQYNYTDGLNWRGFAGSVCERTGVSRCAQVAAAASYATPQTSITVRMGYDYNRDNSNFSQQPTRQYGSRFGCFSFPQQVSLPVTLKSFTANRISTNVLLKWETASEQNNNGFAVEKNSNGTWEQIAYIPSQAANGNSSSELSYQYSDPNNSKSITQYRIRQVDMDNKFKYTETRSVKGIDQKGGVIIFPNPSHDGKINIVFDEKNLVRDITVVDMSGRAVKQIRSATNNSIVIDNLTSGMYTVRIYVPATGEQTVEKVVVNKR